MAETKPGSADAKDVVPYSSMDMVQQNTSPSWNITFSDGTIKCGKSTWAIHRIIVSTKSEFFMKAFSGKFKEGAEALVTLGDEDEEAIEQMLDFMHNGCPAEISHPLLYTGGDSKPTESLAHAQCVDRCVRWSLHALRTSDRYNVPSLQQAAEKCLHTILKGPKTYDQKHTVFSDGLSFSSLCTLVHEGFGDEINHAGLRDRLSRLCAAHWTNLADENSEHYGEFALLGEQCPEFTFKVIQLMRKIAKDSQRALYSDDKFPTGELKPV